MKHFKFFTSSGVKTMQYGGKTLSTKFTKMVITKGVNKSHSEAAAEKYVWGCLADEADCSFIEKQVISMNL